MKLIIKLQCECGSVSLDIFKKVEGKDKKTIIESETLLHDGYGMDLNSFEFFCRSCLEYNKIKFKVIEPKD